MPAHAVRIALAPHCSLSPSGAWSFFLGTCGVSFGIAGLLTLRGYWPVLAFAGLEMLLLGWALVGFGVGMIAPQVYAVAGHAGGGRVLAVVVTFGYATFLCGPAVIGLLVGAFGVQHAMLLPAVLLAALPFIAKVMPSEDRSVADAH